MSGLNLISLFNRLTPKEASVRRVARDVAYGAHERHHYDLYAPKSLSDPLPVLVFFYGGGWYSGSKDDYVWMGHALAAMGYFVAIPDYRVAPEAVYPTFLQDNAAAIAHLIAHVGGWGGDAARLGVCGHSAGGYAAAMMALDRLYFGPRRGSSVIRACAGISGPYDFYPFDVPESRNAFGHWPRPVETQPVSHVARTNTAFLLLQSRADTVVGTHNAVNLKACLDVARADVTLKLYDGLSHQDMAAALSIPFRWKGSVYRDLRAFLKRAL